VPARLHSLGLLALTLVLASGCAHQRCSSHALAVQVLGSGGPIADDARASSAYLVWVEGRARVLIDAGGGSFVRFGQAGAQLEDLELVGLSHLHVDHSAELPTLLKSGFFSARARPLIVAGPTGAGSFPGTRGWLEALVGSAGAYAYLDWVLDPERGRWTVEVVELDHTAGTPIELPLVPSAPLAEGTRGIRVTALGVDHGPVPALAYRVEIDEHVIVFGGDQTGDGPGFVEFAAGAELLIMHHAVGASPDPASARLHATPARIAEIADAAGVETLVLSHHMARSLAELDDSRASIRAGFDGRLEIAEDLACYPLASGRARP
jgi:ribonuclease BN (tRNA processing enzyme)